MNAPMTAPAMVRLPPMTDMHRKPTESSNVKLSGLATPEKVPYNAPARPA